MATLSALAITLLVLAAIAVAVLLFTLLTRIVDFVVAGALLLVAIGSRDILFIFITLIAFLVVVALRINANRPRPRRVVVRR